MTDLEMVKLCAKAMGFKPSSKPRHKGIYCRKGSYVVKFDPLQDDAQAMALMKKMEMIVRAELNIRTSEKYWSAMCPGIPTFWTKHGDLNRAIVECVAKMQMAKATA